MNIETHASRARHRGVLIAVVTVALLPLAACAPIAVAPLSAEDIARMKAAADEVDRSYRIDPGDTLHLRYLFHPEMDQEVLVHPDGSITATGIGPLTVGGLSTGELESLLKEKSSDRLRDPEVVVTIRRLADKTVYVGGEVGRPGMFVYRKGFTPLQAIMAAGGLLSTARVDSVILVRPAAGAQPIARKIDLERVLSHGEREPIHLAPNDVVFVPRTPIANADVWVKQHIIDLIPIRFTVPVPF
jgi:protein involved in polysaccharide export with SLBB domain